MKASKQLNPREMLEYFNIPEDLKHSHSKIDEELLTCGILKLNPLLDATAHDQCLVHVLTYACLNVKFMFFAGMVLPEAKKMALDLFIANMIKLFGEKEEGK